MHIGNKEILGVDYEVHTEVRSGQFRIIEPAAEEGDRAITLGQASTLDGAVAAARTELNKRKVKVSVPFIRPSDGMSGVAHGLHGRTGKVMTRMADGSADQFDTYSKVWREDADPEKVKRYAEIDRQVAELKREQSVIERDIKLPDFGRTVKAAIDAKVAEKAAAA